MPFELDIHKQPFGSSHSLNFHARFPLLQSMMTLVSTSRHLMLQHSPSLPSSVTEIGAVSCIACNDFCPPEPQSALQSTSRSCLSHDNRGSDGVLGLLSSRSIGVQATTSASRIPVRFVPASLSAKAAVTRTERIRTEGLQKLHSILSKHSFPGAVHVLPPIITFFTRGARKVWDWTVPWGSEEDSKLLIGVYRLGYGNWTEIAADCGFDLGGNGQVPSLENVPSAIVLQRRLDYLLGIIATTSHPTKTEERAILSLMWTETARRAGAAAISFVNEVDDDIFPPDMDTFLYLEDTFDQQVISQPLTSKQLT